MTVGWEDEADVGKRGYMAVTPDGQGAYAIRETLEEARVEVCDRLGLDKGFIIGGKYSKRSSAR